MPTQRWSLFWLLSMAFGIGGCQALLDFDRSRIGADAGSDAGTMDAGAAAEDAGEAGDAGDAGEDVPDAATAPSDAGTAEPDAGAEADAGVATLTDAGV